jgi:hypothetical protein
VLQAVQRRMMNERKLRRGTETFFNECCRKKWGQTAISGQHMVTLTHLHRFGSQERIPNYEKATGGVL